MHRAKPYGSLGAVLFSAAFFPEFFLCPVATWLLLNIALGIGAVQDHGGQHVADPDDSSSRLRDDELRGKCCIRPRPGSSRRRCGVREAATSMLVSATVNRNSLRTEPRVPEVAGVCGRVRQRQFAERWYEALLGRQNTTLVVEST